MALQIVMPRLSDSMEEGTILSWLVAEGDAVQEGQPLAEIETDKATVTYEADSGGVILALRVSEGATVAVGAPIAVIGEAGERLVPESTDAGTAARAEPAGAPAQPARDRSEPAGARDRAEPAGAPAQPARDRAEPAGARDRAQPARDRAEPAGAPAQPARDRAERVGVPSQTPASSPPAELAVAASASTWSLRAASPKLGSRPKASPLARRIAAELGVDLTGLAGTGPDGRVVRADVERVATGNGAHSTTAPPPAPASTKGESHVRGLSRLQQTVARRMVQSRSTVPDIELRNEVDMGEAVALRERLREVADPAPSINDFMIKAAALALREFPRVNGAYLASRSIETYSRVNVGFAVAADEALVVPTIFDADRKSLGEIGQDARALAARVRDGSITPSELDGATFTVSNLGMYGVDSFSAVINPPQAAILAVGALKRRPVVDESGQLAARPTVVLTLACDHRILYGADGARFLGRVRELLERPLALLL